MKEIKEKKEKKEGTCNPTKKAAAVVDLKSPTTDPNGSYTGKPDNPRETPVQDADDL